MAKGTRAFWVIALLTLALVSLVSANITITWWINPWRIAPPGFPSDQAPTSEDYPKWVSEEFMRLNPGVKVEYVVVGNAEYSQKMAAAIATRTQPDFFKGPVWDSRWVRAGLLEMIDPYLTAEDWEDFYDAILEEGKIGDHYYIWPWNFGTNGMGTSMLLYTPHFEEAGIDWRKIVEEGWTMEEFVEICKKLTFDSTGDGVVDRFALSFGAKDTHNLLNFIYAFGGELTNGDETVVTFNTPEAVAGLQFLIDLVNVHRVAPRGVEAMGIYDVIGNFHAHNTSIGFGGPYEIGRIDRYLKEGRISEEFFPVVAPFPHVEGREAVAYTTGSGFIIFRQPDQAKRDMVFEFIRFLTNQENLALLETLQYVTARDSVNQTLYLDDPYMNVQVQRFSDIMAHYGRPFFGSQEFPWSQINDHFIAALEGAFSGTKSPQRALDDFVNEANRIIQRLR